MFTPSNYNLMKVGMKLRDTEFGSVWFVIEKIPHGAILRNIGGVKIKVTKDTCKMHFIPDEV